MIGALKQLEAGRKAEDVAREVGLSKHTIYAWKAKYGGMDVNRAWQAKQREMRMLGSRRRVHFQVGSGGEWPNPSASRLE